VRGSLSFSQLDHLPLLLVLALGSDFSRQRILIHDMKSLGLDGKARPRGLEARSVSRINEMRDAMHEQQEPEEGWLSQACYEGWRGPVGEMSAMLPIER
jgi:hypothetical protein